MKKDLAIILGLFLLIVGLLIFGNGFTSATLFTGNRGPVIGKTQKTIPVEVGSLKINAEVAATADLRKNGLAKREALALDSGMLFVFDNESLWGIWMKNMRFAIDIIWIDKDKKIVDIVTDVAPEPGKKDKDLTVYKPRSSALYILEINAGLVRANSINVGDYVNFTLK